MISIRGVTRERGTRFGGNTNIDPVAVSDASGQFIINGREPFDAAGVDVEARGLAKGIFQNLATGDARHELKLTEGVTLKGRVLHNGEPLVGVEVGAAGADRRSETFVGDFSVATDRKGQFLFMNLPARTQYYLYGIMKSLGDKGAIAAQPLRTQDDGSAVDVGDIPVKRGYTVGGQIRLTDGKALSTNVHVLLAREQAWDTQQMEADETGQFHFTGVPPESVSISAGVTGYRLSLRNG